ncbi:MAG: VapE domain-containing protein [Clostridium sp.]|uniref:VapE domain-containing protein n=1 Tax=Clostridium sp. TaxID=1506 RepID=UPI003EE70535
MGNNVVNLNNIKQGYSVPYIEWKYGKLNKEGIMIPFKIWENLKQLLDENGVEVKYNVIKREVEIEGRCVNSKKRNGVIQDIFSLQVKSGLNMKTQNEVKSALDRISEDNQYNEFIESIKENENTDYSIIEEVFNCIPLGEENEGQKEFYFKLFTKWCLNVVKMANNDIDNGYVANGVLILQGGQGTRKSTFFKTLFSHMPSYFNSESSINPSNTDSITKETSYVVTELAEIGTILKHEADDLKRFFTSSYDEYRSPYATVKEKHPRLCTFCGTVNDKDFLRDRTGNRRFWIIPVGGLIDIETQSSFDMAKFWGAVFSLWKSNSLTDYIDQEEQRKLANLNITYNLETDTSVVLTDICDWESDERTWVYVKPSNLARYLKEAGLGNNITSKTLINEMERRGVPIKNHRIQGSTRRCFKMPRPAGILVDYLEIK